MMEVARWGTKRKTPGASFLNKTSGMKTCFVIFLFRPHTAVEMVTLVTGNMDKNLGVRDRFLIVAKNSSDMAETDAPESSKAEPDTPHTSTGISGRCGTCPWNSFEVVIGGWQSEVNPVSSGAVFTGETMVRFPTRSADESVLRFEPGDGDHFGDLDSDCFGSY